MRNTINKEFYEELFSHKKFKIGAILEPIVIDLNLDDNKKEELYDISSKIGLYIELEDYDRYYEKCENNSYEDLIIKALDELEAAADKFKVLDFCQVWDSFVIGYRIIDNLITEYGEMVDEDLFVVSGMLSDFIKKDLSEGDIRELIREHSWDVGDMDLEEIIEWDRSIGFLISFLENKAEEYGFNLSKTVKLLRDVGRGEKKYGDLRRKWWELSNNIYSKEEEVDRWIASKYRDVIHEDDNSS